MRVLVVLAAAVACVVAKPAVVNYGYSAIAPWAGYPYGAAYNPLAYSAVLPAVNPAVIPAVAPALAYAAPAVSPFVAHAGVKSQYHSQDELGQASYGHAEPGQSHTAIQDAAGNKVGRFSFINPEGKLVHTDYVADAAGYRVASNDLPVAPVHAAVQPVPVVDTPEVAAAKIAHLAEVEAAKTRSKRAIVTPAGTEPIVAAPVLARALPYAHPYSAPLVSAYSAYPYSLGYTGVYPHAYPTTNTVPVVAGPNGYLADTPEVAAAKANHFAEVAAATARVAYPFVL